VRTSKTLDGDTTQYVLDLATSLPVVVSDTEAVYLYGLDIIAQQQAERQYYFHDGLGSVRQLLDSTGDLEANYAYDPFGVPVVTGDASNPYRFTGEAWDEEVELLYLRARYYQPETGRFITKDLWTGDPSQPQTMAGYAYVGNNPTTYVDPGGTWRWYSTFWIYHLLIEAHYEGTLLGLNPFRQLEYPIPGTPHRHADMFDSVTGDVYEIEPAGGFSEGVRQVKGYVADLRAAAGAGDLTGRYFGVPYNWNATLFHIGTEKGWPGKYKRQMPGFPAVDLVADYVGEGVVLYWLEPNALSLLGAVPFVVPNKRLVKPPNWVPGSQPAYQPAYVVSWQEACRYTLVIVGGAIITVTIVEDLLSGGAGIPDDIVTVPAGILLIYWGQRAAVFVPTADA
jgi:RHS repeat-associated protein